MVLSFFVPQDGLWLTESAISAIVIAIQMITKYTKKLKYKRKIVLVTDGRGLLDADPDGIAEISKKIKADEMELVVLYMSPFLVQGLLLTIDRGVDFDDPDYGFKEEDKDFEKVHIANQYRDSTR